MPRSTARAQYAPKSNSQNACRTQHTYDRRPFTPGFLNPNVREVFVKFSAIISTGYDRTKETLYIKFKNGSIYACLHVPESVFSAFLAAESYGKFLHRYILWQYKCECVCF